MYQLKTTERGFTLLELLIVVAVIAILASAVVANLGAARNKANDAKIRSELKSVDQAIAVYMSTASASDLTTAGGVSNWDALATKLQGASLLPNKPIHPSASANPPSNYYYMGVVTNASLNYVLGGKLVGEQDKCYVIINGAAKDGSCTGTLPNTSTEYTIQ